MHNIMESEAGPGGGGQGQDGRPSGSGGPAISSQGLLQLLMQPQAKGRPNLGARCRCGSPGLRAAASLHPNLSPTGSSSSSSSGSSATIIVRVTCSGGSSAGS